MKLRPYQTRGIGSIWDYFQEGGTGNPLVAMPTATGKSVVIGGFIQSVFQAFSGQRILALTHVKELIEQNHEKLLTMWPAAPAGINSAGLNRRDTKSPIIFGGIQSVYKKAAEIGHVDLILIDEAHLVSPDANTNYIQFIEALKAINPYLKVIGFTATPYRLKQGYITDGGLFTDICYDLTSRDEFNNLLDDGYLAPLIPKRTSEKLNLDGVGIRGGEYIAGQLQEAVDQEAITYRALQETMEYGHNRHHWLIFASGVDHAIHIQMMLESMGVTAAVVHGKSSPTQRKEALSGFRSGKYRALVNNNVLTTGYDFPGIDLIVMIRPTASPGLWVQMLGRGTRPLYGPGFDLETVEGRHLAMMASFKRNCLVLDFAGNTPRLGPINDPVIPQKPGKKGGPAPVRECEKCGTYNHAAAKICIFCGMEFPVNVRFGFEAGTGDLIASKDLPEVHPFNVTKVVYSRHSKADRPDAMLVTYYCGIRRFKNYVCLEHGGYATKKAKEWWREAWPSEVHGELVPETTTEALNLVKHLKEPKALKVWVNKKYPEILNYDYDGTGFGS